jgi:hypothetical protein
MNLFVLCKTPTAETLRLVEADPEAGILLVGKAILSDTKAFGKRSLYVVSEEVRELGFEARLDGSVQARTSSELISMICESHVLNLD